MSIVGRAGFTLIEVSVVLVIIGLVAGGIFVGRELIAQAQLRAAISQVEQYKTAVNTFRTKYNYLPGDIPAAQAAATGLIARGGGPGDGNGNGVVEGLGQSVIPDWNNMAYLGGETIFFWTDLSSAGLIPGSFTDSTDAPVICIPCAGPGLCFLPCDFSKYAPQFKVGRKAFIFAFDAGMYTLDNAGYPSGLLFEIMAGQASAPAGYLAAMPTLTIAEASSIDVKIDDGQPLTGTVMVPVPGRTNGVDGSGRRIIPPLATGSSASFCVSNAAANRYNLAFPESVACDLVVLTKM